jgi:hypothetical protein
MIFTALQRSDAFPLPQRDPLASLVFARDLISCDLRAPHSRPARSLRAEPYGILTSGRPIRNRKLTRVNAKNRSSKESIMLDVVFVVLGLAVLALMGAYAVGLRQL